MSLLDIAKGLKETGYDPRKSKVNSSNQHLPEGEYVVVLTGAEARVLQSGWETINYAFEVRDPESPYHGQKQFVGMGTLDTWKKDGRVIDLTNLVERTVKFFYKAVVLAGDHMVASDLEDNKTMADALKRQAVGKKFVLEIEEYTKRDGSTDYNYDLSEYQGSQESAPEISDDDLPF